MKSTAITYLLFGVGTLIALSADQYNGTAIYQWGSMNGTEPFSIRDGMFTDTDGTEYVGDSETQTVTKLYDGMEVMEDSIDTQ